MSKLMPSFALIWLLSCRGMQKEAFELRRICITFYSIHF